MGSNGYSYAHFYGGIIHSGEILEVTQVFISEHITKYGKYTQWNIIQLMKEGN